MGIEGGPFDSGPRQQPQYETEGRDLTALHMGDRIVQDGSVYTVDTVMSADAEGRTIIALDEHGNERFLRYDRNEQAEVLVAKKPLR